MGKFVDLAGLWGQPLSPLAESASQLRDVLALDPRIFGATSPWLGLRSPWWAAIASANAAPPVGWRCSRCAFVAVFGNAMIANHLFASAADAEFQDRLVASDVMNYVRSLDPALVDDRRPIKIETIGALVRPETPLRQARDTFGASFLQWDAGRCASRRRICWSSSSAITRPGSRRICAHGE